MFRHFVFIYYLITELNGVDLKNCDLRDIRLCLYLMRALYHQIHERKSI